MQNMNLYDNLGTLQKVHQKWFDMENKMHLWNYYYAPDCYKVEKRYFQHKGQGHKVIDLGVI